MAWTQESPSQYKQTILIIGFDFSLLFRLLHIILPFISRMAISAAGCDCFPDDVSRDDHIAPNPEDLSSVRLSSGDLSGNIESADVPTLSLVLWRPRRRSARLGEPGDNSVEFDSSPLPEIRDPDCLSTNDDSISGSAGRVAIESPAGTDRPSDFRIQATSKSVHFEAPQSDPFTGRLPRDPLKKNRQDGRDTYTGSKPHRRTNLAVDTLRDTSRPDTSPCAAFGEATTSSPEKRTEKAVLSTRRRAQETDEFIPNPDRKAAVHSRFKIEMTSLDHKRRNHASARRHASDAHILQDKGRRGSGILGFLQGWCTSDHTSKSARETRRSSKAPSSRDRATATSKPPRAARETPSKRKSRALPVESTVDISRPKHESIGLMSDRASGQPSGYSHQPEEVHEMTIQSTLGTHTREAKRRGKARKKSTISHEELMKKLDGSYDEQTTHNDRKHRANQERDRGRERRGSGRSGRYLSDPSENRNTLSRENTRSTPGTVSRLFRQLFSHDPIQSTAMTHSSRRHKRPRRALKVDPDTAWAAEVSNRGKEFGVREGIQAESTHERTHSAVGATTLTSGPEKRSRRDTSGRDRAFKKGTPLGKHRERKQGGREV